LVLFGPRKLPELGRTIGKALTEFRRASSDLRSTFEREMQNLEREDESLKEVTHQTANEIYHHVNFGYGYDDNGHASENVSSETTHPSTVGASEVPGAESHGTTTAVAELPAPADAASAAPVSEDLWADFYRKAAQAGVEGTVPRSAAPNASQNS
ncbi:MAG TPA: twin-arginine translocase TatA/TatE family subunit, partial [Bryobacteraceae bacterium]|nr:twin-arginine translocase TatA/TatE family subunit [Bryobacteraceae bacterium]